MDQIQKRISTATPSIFLPLALFFLNYQGNQTKTSQTLESLRLLLRVLSCPFFFFFFPFVCVDMKKIWSCLWWYLLCGRESEITVGMQIDYQWPGPSENHSLCIDLLQKETLSAWVQLALCKQPGLQTPRQRQERSEILAATGALSILTSSQACYKCVLAFESLLVYSEHTLSHFQLTSLERRMRSLFNTQAVISKDIRILWFFFNFSFYFGV